MYIYINVYMQVPLSSISEDLIHAEIDTSMCDILNGILDPRGKFRRLDSIDEKGEV
jgi:hypothetical protein